MASDLGSVFAPYRPPTRLDAATVIALRVAGDRAGGEVHQGHAVRLDAARCEHPHPVTLANVPPPLVRRCPGEPVDSQDDQGPRRTRIWEFDPVLHCSIIGTCLTTGELRQILAKAKLAPAGLSDHDLHHKGVNLAARHDLGGRLLQKALDRRHKLSISQFGRARTPAEVLALWREAMGRGDIPGAYWSTLTHPAATRDVVRQAFGDVHMLSHLVGAANRADISRLCALERCNAELEDKLARQQQALHATVQSRDATIQDLRDALRRELRNDAAARPDEDAGALRQVVADLERRLARETHRRGLAEARLAEARRDAARAGATHDRLTKELRQAREELAVVDQPDEAAAETQPWWLDGLSVLYVGGRPNQAAHFRGLAERHGATLLHHDGGVEHHTDLLAGLVSRVALVVFPVDCVSHEAALAVKRLCRHTGKPFLPLRSSGATSLLAALRRHAVERRMEGEGVSVDD